MLWTSVHIPLWLLKKKLTKVHRMLRSSDTWWITRNRRSSIHEMRWSSVLMCMSRFWCVRDYERCRPGALCVFHSVTEICWWRGRCAIVLFESTCFQSWRRLPFSINLFMHTLCNATLSFSFEPIENGNFRGRQYAHWINTGLYQARHSNHNLKNTPKKERYINHPDVHADNPSIQSSLS